jgi:eukaryotic-like serine/threonine-protein kinase
MNPASVLQFLPHLAGVAMFLVFLMFVYRAYRGGGAEEELKDWRDEIKNWSERVIEGNLASLVSQGQYRMAGEIAYSLERWEDAAEYFQKGNQQLAAAQSLLKLGKLKEAARIYQELDELKKAADLFEKAGEMGSAGQIYYQLGEFQRSARHFEESGDKKRAAEIYLGSGFFRKAHQLFEELGDYQKAAESLLKALDEAESRLGKEVELPQLSFYQELTSAAASDFKKSGDTERTIELLDRAHLYEESGRLLAESGRLKEASERYLSAGLVLEAASCLEQTGQAVKAAELRAQYHLGEGQKQEAIKELEKAGDWDRVAELYQELGQKKKGAEALDQAGRFKEAGKIWEDLENFWKAGEDYEKAGAFDLAARCFDRAGEITKVSEMYEQARDFYNAGVSYYHRGLLEKAIRALQQVEKNGQDYPKTCSLLGKIFQEKGMLNLAKESLKLAVESQDISRSNIDDFYQLASLEERLGELDAAMVLYEKIMLVDIEYLDVRVKLDRLKQSKTVIDSRSPSISQEETQTLREMPSMGGIKPVRYEIIEEIGRGGMGIVYKARDTILDRVVAYKVLPANLKDHPAALRNFFREAKSAARLNQTNIVTVYDAGEEAGNYYIAMEYIEGETVKQILNRDGKVPVKAALLIAGQVGRALEYAHERKVVHRDIKSSNIMWTKDKQTKLMDFGLAKVLEEVKGYQTLASGTPYYMSPEQALGKDIDHRTDIYSLGVTMFEMCTGQLPFKSGDAVYHHIHTPPPEAKSLVPDLDKNLNKIILRCMQKDPKDRFQDTKEFLEALRKVKIE